MSGYGASDFLNNYSMSVDEMMEGKPFPVLIPINPFPNPFSKQEEIQSVMPSHDELTSPGAKETNLCPWPRKGEPFRADRWPSSNIDRVDLSDVTFPRRYARSVSGDWMHNWAENMYRLNYMG
ncbi:uncharacterized protein LOC101858768 [Aplysia californica]|uniref:Uncharacterized protein LOC101858768 n=1 Tax=Aplysia californica TaxID=6500 RepID=A0ABM0JI70_APLCA|nr:uncharacterized protein LOC101858768 [Aplysia californica]